MGHTVASSVGVPIVQSLVFTEGRWVEGNPAVMGPLDQSFWLATMVFDGGRVFDGLAPDLDLHMARAIRSAETMGLRPNLAADEILALALEGSRRFPRETAIYVRPTFWATGGFMYPEPASTKFLLVLDAMPMPEPQGFATCLSPFRRPDPRTAPTVAKAACLYPNTGLAFKEAEDRGFTNPVMLDLDGNVAEFAGSNLFIVKDGAVATPAANGTFLAGITRRRVLGLLGDAGLPVAERAITYDEVREADEIFSTGNYMKVSPVTRIEDRAMQPGPVYRKARALYMQWAKDAGLRLQA
ncbi:MAG: branched-chain amino acid aminotransferase [Alphaproteobacteria bacterium]|nr:branched-chain amino acid aminotransferase [Alphaproteobacteria bacterium]